MRHGDTAFKMDLSLRWIVETYSGIGAESVRLPFLYQSKHTQDETGVVSDFMLDS